MFALRSIRRFSSYFILFTLLIIPLAASHAQGGDLTETFDNPTPPGWELSPQTAVAEGALHINAPGHALYLQKGWQDLTLSVRVRRSGVGEALIQYRFSDTDSFVVSLSTKRIAIQRRQKETLTDLKEAPSAIPEGQWVTVVISVSGETHSLTVDNTLVASVTDKELMRPGSIMFQVMDRAAADFDDLTVRESTAPIGEATTVSGAPPASTAAPAAGVPAYQAEAWTRLGGPPGGLGYDIRMQPDNPDIMYVTDAWVGEHKSVDGGKTWVPVNKGMEPIPGAGGRTFCTTVDPHDYNTIWAGTQWSGHIYRSTDGGKTWQARDTGLPGETGSRSVRGITIDPVDRNVVYAGVEVSSPGWAGKFINHRFDLVRGEVYKSTDAGQSWKRIWEGGNLARYIWVDPRNTQRLYVSTGLFDRDAADSDIANGVWGGVGILRSDDGGQTWTVLNQANGLGGLYVPSLFMHPTNPDILLAAVTNPADPGGEGAYVTRNGGDTWERILARDQGFGMEAVEISTKNPDVWYAAAESVIYRSDDAGKNWQQFMLGTADRTVGVPIDLQVDPRDPMRIFDNNYGGSNFVSTDGGQTWADASKGYTGAAVRALAVLPGDGRSLLSGANTATFYSADGGETWVGTGLPSATAIYIHNPSGQIIVGTESGRVNLSADSGKTWKTTRVVDTQGIPTHMHALAVAPSNPQVVYAGFAEGPCWNNLSWAACQKKSLGMFRSTDGGNTWQQLEGIPFADVGILNSAVSPNDPQTLFAATGKGLFLSRDGGKAWQHLDGFDKVTIKAPISNPDMAALKTPVVFDVVFDPFDSQVIYASSTPGGVLRSQDGGQTWRQAVVGMDPNDAIYSLRPDPNRQGVLYAASERSGVYVSIDGAKTWRQINNGLAIKETRFLALSQDGSVLYVGLNYGGVFRLGQP